MIDNISDYITSTSLDNVNINDKENIEYVEVLLQDYRIDTLIFNHYGYNIDTTYGISSELIIFLIFIFNDFTDLLSIKGSIKLPVINNLLDNVYIVDNVVNGVYENSNIYVDETTSNSNKIVDELRLRLKPSQTYNSETGIIKF